MKVVILCGGKGTRLKEETEFKPKPLVEIGGMPIVWHIMKIYSSYGYNEFILCLGYKGNMIKEFFLDAEHFMQDFTLDLRSRKMTVHNEHKRMPDWKITFVETGDETLTGGRIKAVQKYVGNEDFMVTYGDGVANIDVSALVEFHKQKGKICTVTGVNPSSRYGLIKVGENQEVLDFNEKPPMTDIINGGFMVMKPEFFDYLMEDSMFESTVLPKLSKDLQVAVFHHKGFWHCMDTFKDYESLNTIWREASPWKIWKE